MTILRGCDEPTSFESIEVGFRLIRPRPVRFELRTDQNPLFKDQAQLATPFLICGSGGGVKLDGFV